MVGLWGCEWVERQDTDHVRSGCGDGGHVRGRGWAWVVHNCDDWVDDLINNRSIAGDSNISLGDVADEVRNRLNTRGVNIKPPGNQGDQIAILEVDGRRFLGLSPQLEHEVGQVIGTRKVKDRASDIFTSLEMGGYNRHAETSSVLEYMIWNRQNGGNIGRDAGSMFVEYRPYAGCVFEPTTANFDGNLRRLMLNAQMNSIDVYFPATPDRFKGISLPITVTR